MIKPSKVQMQRLLEALEGQASDLIPTCRWLIVGRHLADVLGSDISPEPDLDQLLKFMRWVQHQEPQLIDTATLLAATSPLAEQLHIEVQLDALAARNPIAWNHPVQVLARPRSPYGVLLAACRRRLDVAALEDQERLLSVAGKLERAIELEERARRRRQLRQAKEREERRSGVEDVH